MEFSGGMSEITMLKANSKQVKNMLSKLGIYGIYSCNKIMRSKVIYCDFVKLKTISSTVAT